jgi:hypothetical protein
MLQMVVIVGMMVMVGLIGRVEAQCGGYLPDMCNGIDFDAVRYGAAATINGQVQLSNSEACFFATTITRMGSVPSGARVNGSAMTNCGNTGWGQQPCATVLENQGITEVDGGFYIHIPPGNWAVQEFQITGGTQCVDDSDKTLTVKYASLGSGTTNPAEGEHIYAHDTPVTITATPDAGSVFSGWLGCPNPAGNTCQVTMRRNWEVTAVFNAPGGTGCAFAKALGTHNAFCDDMPFDEVDFSAANVNMAWNSPRQCRFIRQSPDISWNANSAIINGQPAGADVQNRIRNGIGMVDGGYYIYFPPGHAVVSGMTAGVTVCKPTATITVDFDPEDITYGDDFDVQVSVTPSSISFNPDTDAYFVGTQSNGVEYPEVDEDFNCLDWDYCYTKPRNPGDYIVWISINSDTHEGSAEVPFTIKPKPLTWNSDGEVNNSGTIVTPPTLNGVINDDNVTVIPGTVTGTTASGFGIEGPDSWKYIAPADQPVFNASNSILSSDRGAPQKMPETEAVNSASTGEFSAGPNPADKSAGAVSFFWQGKRIKSASLTIFDASGNVVKKRVGISDRRGDPSRSPVSDTQRRHVGSWDLKDAKGRLVSDGTYLVKGVITTSDGSKERVSLMVGVK